jgi:hypothetical protein
MLEQIRSMLCHRLAFCDFRPKRDHQLVGDTPKDEQVNLTQEVRKIFMCLVISNLLGVVDAAIQGSVDCEDYISHLIVLTPSLVQRFGL